MKTIALCLASASLALAALPAQASYVIDVQQVGANVVATGSGSIDWTNLSFVGFYDPGSAAVNASAGFFVVGAPSYGDYYSGSTGPASFGSGGRKTLNLGPGDVITHVNDQPVTTVREMQKAILGLPIGQPAEFIVVRKGQAFQTKVAASSMTALMRSTELGPTSRIMPSGGIALSP